tara:strand:- start:290 stop:1747 length:1458 start_codon:yes stop_codon:yes gene_type:complete
MQYSKEKKIMKLILDKLSSNITFIKGVAGAGKTQDLVDAAKNSPLSAIHYISLGRENAKNTRKRMPGNVTCSSFHALARKKMGIKSERIVPSLSLADMSKQLKRMSLNPKETKILESMSLMLNLFCFSSTPFSRFFDLHKKNIKAFPYLTQEEQTYFYRLFSQYWQLLWVDEGNEKVTHDMYLKAYEQNVKQVSLDYLFVDEGQDMNDTMFSIVEKLSLSTPWMKVVVFCDLHQSIFGFCGATSKLKMQTFTHTLNQSRRFGQSLANLVNKFMNDQRAVLFENIVGNPAKDTLIGYNGGINDLLEKIEKKHKPTIVSRHNITLWHLVKNLTSKGIYCHVLGDNYSDIKFLESLSELYRNSDLRSAKLGGSYETYKRKAEISQDAQALLACRFVESIKEEPRTLFSRLKKHLVDIKKADVLLTTTHQSKGLEFNHVIMADDFKKTCNPKTNMFMPIDEAEVYLLYTAMTRAKNTLTLPKSWTGILN